MQVRKNNNRGQNNYPSPPFPPQISLYCMKNKPAKLQGNECPAQRAHDEGGDGLIQLEGVFEYDSNVTNDKGENDSSEHGGSCSS